MLNSYFDISQRKRLGVSLTILLFVVAYIHKISSSEYVITKKTLPLLDSNVFFV